MRYALAAASVLCFLGFGLNRAQATGYYCDGRQMPAPHMNKHCPYYITCNPYWAPCSYGIWGPTDPSYRPVNGMPVPPYYPKMCMPSAQQEQQPLWHRYMRSPRDFFMLQY
jgi:hypothetical protein